MDLRSTEESESETVSELEFLAASSEASAGNFDEAELILRRPGKLSTSGRTLDLLARIAVYKGQFAEARRLWLAVLAGDPTNECAKAALARLGRSWLFLAFARRVAYLTGLAALFCLSAVGLLILIGGSFPMRHEPISPVVLTLPRKYIASPLSMPATPAQPSSADEPEQQANRKVESEVAVTLPLFSVAGCSISSNNREVRIVPEEGLFSYRCEFVESAWERLARIAGALEDKVSNYWVVVEGHTDSDPMPANSQYQDNYELGLYRAFAVGQVLRAKGEFPFGSILIASAAAAEPPFPDDDAVSRIRNRTAIIRLVPKIAVSGGEVVTAHEFAR